MKFSSAALLAWIGSAWLLLCHILINWMGLDRSRSLIISGVCGFSNLAFSIGLFIFFLVAYNRYALDRLKTASILGLIASVWLFLNGAIRIVPGYEQNFITLISPLIMMLANLLSDILIILFFILFIRKSMNFIIRRFTILALVGSGLKLITSLFGLIKIYYQHQYFLILSARSEKFLLLGFILAIFLFYMFFRLNENKT